MVHLAGFVAPDRVREGPALVNGNRGQVDPVRDVSHGVDVGHVGALIRIDRNAMAFHRDAGGFQVEPRQEGAAAGGQQHAVAADPLAALGDHRQCPRFAFDGGGAVGQADRDAFGLHRLLHRQAAFPIEAPQQVIAAHQLGDLHAQAIEDAGELTGDEAGADDDDLLGEPRQFEQVITDPAQLGPWNLGAMGPAADRDQDALGRQPPRFAASAVLHADRAVIGQAPPAPHQLHPRLLEEADVQLVEAIHLRAHLAQQDAAVVADCTDAPAVARGIA